MIDFFTNPPRITPTGASVSGRRYGWVHSARDARDYFAAQPPLSVVAPALSDLRLLPHTPPVYDQSQLGSCTGNGSAAAFDFVRHMSGHPFMTPSRLFIYYNERVVEGTVEFDAGAQIRDSIKVLAKYGVCPESEWPYDIAKFSEQPPPGDYRDALLNRALRYTRLMPNRNQVEVQLGVLKVPIIFGFTVYESFESESVAKTGIMPMPNFNTESVLGGHCVCAWGYDRARGLVLCRNSWGPFWGEGGYFWMPYNFFFNPNVASDMWAISLESAA